MWEIANIFQPLVDGGVTILEFWHGVTGDWGGAIILLAFTLQLALFPVAVIQRAAENTLLADKPRWKELEERYGGDKERLHEEFMRLPDRGKGFLAYDFLVFLLLLWLGIKVAGFYLFESRAFADAIGGSEAFLFLPDLGQPLRDVPFVLAATMALYLGVAVVERRLEPGSNRIWAAWNVTWLVLFIVFPAGFIVFLIALSTWGCGEVLVLNKLSPRPAPAMSEDL